MLINQRFKLEGHLISGLRGVGVALWWAVDVDGFLALLGDAGVFAGGARFALTHFEALIKFCRFNWSRFWLWVYPL